MYVFSLAVDHSCTLMRLPQIATGSAHQSASSRHPEPLFNIAGPSKQTPVQRDMHSVRPAPSVELISDDDDIIELPQAPKRARRGHSTSTSQKRLKAEKPKRQPVSIVISDSDADIDTMIEMMEGSSVPLTRPQTGDGQVHEVGRGYAHSSITRSRVRDFSSIPPTATAITIHFTLVSI